MSLARRLCTLLLLLGLLGLTVLVVCRIERVYIDAVYASLDGAPGAADNSAVAGARARSCHHDMTLA